MKLETRLVQAGNRRDPHTGAVVQPIYHSTTYSHPALGESTGFDYSRLANPNRKTLEGTIASLENGDHGFAFASGMAAISCVCQLFKSGDHIVAGDDLYGGTYRLLEQILRPNGIEITFLDISDQSLLEQVIRPNTKAIFVETPTNPMMKICDLEMCANVAAAHHLLFIVDNTFMTPYLQRPLDIGADIVVHSGTKYLGGHNDVLSGLVVVKGEKLSEQLSFYQNSQGAVLSPQDSWLMLRGMKTLALRMSQHEQNTKTMAEWLTHQPIVRKVYYPGLKDHPRRQIQEKQAQGYGGMVSFEVTDTRYVTHILDSVKVITFAESLGGVESLITYPAVQTHHDIPKDVRDQLGVTDSLLRLSVGIEHVDDLIADLEQAFQRAHKEVTL